MDMIYEEGVYIHKPNLLSRNYCRELRDWTLEACENLVLLGLKLQTNTLSLFGLSLLML